jgi:hypothetical protein
LCVGKSRLCFIERDSVFGQVGCCLRRVPFKHVFSIYRIESRNKLDVEKAGGGERDPGGGGCYDAFG